MSVVPCVVLFTSLLVNNPTQNGLFLTQNDRGFGQNPVELPFFCENTSFYLKSTENSSGTSPVEQKI